MKRLEEKVEAKRKRTLAGGSKKVKKKMAEEKYQMPDEVERMAMKMNPVDESKSLERLNAVVVVDQMVRMKGMKMKVHEDDVGNDDDNAGARRKSGNAVAVANDDVVVDDEEGMMMKL